MQYVTDNDLPTVWVTWLLPGGMVGLIKICHLIQNLLWEKNVRNKDGDCMEVIRLKVRCGFHFHPFGQRPLLFLAVT